MERLIFIAVRDSSFKLLGSSNEWSKSVFIISIKIVKNIHDERFVNIGGEQTEGP